MKNALAISLVATCVAIVAAGCDFKPPDGVLICATSGKACPDGYACASDDRCYREGHGPVDMSTVATIDMAVPKNVKLRGQACDTATDVCDGGDPCIDGVCCDSPCADTCKACNVEGQLGTCTLIPAGKMPSHGSCNAADPTTCGHDGTCDGTGLCANFAAGTACGPSSCDVATGAYQPSPECDGKGACNTLAGYNCMPYRCKDATQCYGPTCTGTPECSGTNSCVNMSCGLLGNGRTCTAGAQCTSGNCVDGVCCNTACNGQCEACDIVDGSGNKGTCTQVAGAPHGSRTACTAAGTTCGGTCGTSRTACDFPGNATQCAKSCNTGNNQLTVGACNGAGTCSMSTALCPNNYACNGTTTCNATCTGDAQCQSGFFCSAGSCVSKCTNGVKDNGESDIDCGGPNCAKCAMDKQCTAASDCVSNSCVGSFPGLCTPAFGPPSWDVTTSASMPYGRDRAVAMTSKGKIYLVGGFEWYTGSGTTRPSKSVDVYTPNYLTSANGVGAWAHNPTDLPSNERVDLAGAVFPSTGEMRVLGGWYPDLSDSDLSEVDRVTPPTTAWTAFSPDTPVARSHWRAAVASDNQLYVLGGGPADSGACSAVMYRFTTASGTWASSPATFPSLGSARCDHTLVPDPSGRLYAFFGRTDSGGVTNVNAIEGWKPGDAAWGSAGLFSGYGYYGSGALGSDGRIYVLGGQTNATTLVDTGHRLAAFTPTRGMVGLSAPFSVTRAATVTGPDGRLYVIGGSTSATVGSVPSQFMHVFGPLITLNVVSQKVGQNVLVTAKNFAAGGTIKLYWDTIATGNLLATAPNVTDASGNYAAGTLTVTIPTATANTTHKIIAIDERAAFPVSADVTISP